MICEMRSWSSFVAHVRCVLGIDVRSIVCRCATMDPAPATGVGGGSVAGDSGVDGGGPRLGSSGGGLGSGLFFVLIFLLFRVGGLSAYTRKSRFS